MRRAYALSEAYGYIRETFGKKINQHILFQKSLLGLQIACESNFLLGFFLIKLLGKEDCHTATEREIALLRLLTPVAKLYTAKGAISSASELIEMIGGLGYLEDTNIPWLLRDAQVLSIWEGTTNVLSLDMLRAIEKDKGLPAFHDFAIEMLSSVHLNALQEAKKQLSDKLKFLFDFMTNISSAEEREGCARDIAFYLAELTIGLLWLEFIQKNPKEKDITFLRFWLAFKVSDKSLGSYKILKSAIS